MKWLWLLLAPLALAQNPVQITPTTVDPTGQVCNSTRLNEKTPDGKLYSCQNGTMAQIGGSGVGFNGLINQSMGVGNSPITETMTAGTGGVTLNTLVQLDSSSPSKVIANTTTPYGIAQANVSASASVEVARYGSTNCVTDTGGSTAGDWAIIGTGSAIDCKDSGQSLLSNIPQTTIVVGVFRSSVSAGAAALIDLWPGTRGTQGAAGAIACSGNPGSTTLTYLQSCVSLTSIPVGAVYVCPIFGGCTMASQVNFVANCGSSQRINVMCYGATGNGTTDDTTAIQSALTTAGLSGAKGTVYFPSGQYLTGTGFTVPPGVSIEGDGFVDANTASNMTRVFTTTTNVIVFNFGSAALGTSGAQSGNVIKNILVNCTSKTGTVGLQFGISTSSEWNYNYDAEDMSVSSCGTNILVLNAFVIGLTNVNSYGAIGAGLYLDAPNYTTTIKVVGGNYSQNGTNGILLGGPTGTYGIGYNSNVSILQAVIEGNTGTELLATSPGYTLSVRDSYFQGSTGHKAIDLSGWVTASTGITPGSINIANNLFGGYSTAIYSSTALANLIISGNWDNSLADFVNLASGTTGVCLQQNTTSSALALNGAVSTCAQVHVIGFIIDGGGSVITTGALKDFPTANYACTINQATISADQSGSITVDIWKINAAIPTSSNKISSTHPVTLSSAQLNQNSALTGWTLAVSVGDVFGFNIVSASTVTHVNGQLWCQ